MLLLRCLLLFLAGLLAAGLPGQGITLDPPGDREFVLDRAGLLSPDDVVAIRSICDKLLTEHATPILVVTIESMAGHYARSVSIESFATRLFNQWQIGHAEINNAEWNTGILLLVSRDDRRARMELGAGWGREKDYECERIMDERIVPMFKAGAFAEGIRAGVEALDALARSKPLPEIERPPRPFWHWLVLVGAIALAIFTAVSLKRRGSSGWAWLMWAGLFSIIGMLIYQMMANRNRGGGFGGGSFGGGSSGGGGASGSW